MIAKNNQINHLNLLNPGSDSGRKAQFVPIFNRDASQLQRGNYSYKTLQPSNFSTLQQLQQFQLLQPPNNPYNQ